MATIARTYDATLTMDDGTRPTLDDLSTAVNALHATLIRLYQHAKSTASYRVNEATSSLWLSITFNYVDLARHGIYDILDYRRIERDVRPETAVKLNHGRQGKVTLKDAFSGKLELVSEDDTTVAHFTYATFDGQRQPVDMIGSDHIYSTVAYIRNALIGHLNVEVPGLKDAFIGVWSRESDRVISIFFSKSKLDPVKAIPQLEKAAASLAVAFMEPPGGLVHGARVRLNKSV